MRYLTLTSWLVVALSALVSSHPCFAQESRRQEEIDQRVQDFLERSRYEWRDMNVPGSDGKVLYDLIVENNYTKALEVGTSTGHSAIWIAWALSKTGANVDYIAAEPVHYPPGVKLPPAPKP